MRNPEFHKIADEVAAIYSTAVAKKCVNVLAVTASIGTQTDVMTTVADISAITDMIHSYGTIMDSMITDMKIERAVAEQEKTDLLNGCWVELDNEDSEDISGVIELT
jgi:uncharacterized protein (UPF0218 family)